MSLREMRKVAVIKNELEHLYKLYHRPELLGEDPLGLVSGEMTSEDFEVVSYVSASLSYGRVEQIRKSLQGLWSRLEAIGLGTGGAGLSEYLVDNSGITLKKEFGKVLKGWVHRFNDEKDILSLFVVLQSALKEYKSLGAVYLNAGNEATSTERLNHFVSELRAFVKGETLERFKWFACSPSEKSTCKRMVMWLRWMLRSDDIDPGIWTKKYSAQGIGPHLGFIPMDTHIHKWAMKKQLLSTKNPSWKSVEELTHFLKLIDPQDPARFDFCICHSGMTQFREAFKVQRTL